MGAMRRIEASAEKTDAPHVDGWLASPLDPRHHGSVRGEKRGGLVGEFEAVGDMVTGAMAGRAVEPKAGEIGADGHTHERCCLNCGATLTGEFCSACGQHAHIHRTLSAFFHDFLHGVLHFEGKIWRTLPLLAWKPGVLTRRYIDGQRARFVSPIALFLFSVFLMFAILSATGNANPNFGSSNHDLATQQKQLETDLAGLRTKRSELAAQGQSTTEAEEEIADMGKQLDVIQTMREKGVTSAVLENEGSTVQSDIPLVKEAFLKAKENPDLLFYKLKTNSYKWSWAIIPLSVPFLWLMFPFSRRFRLYDHVVFVTYSLSFMTLLFAIGTLLAAAGINAIAPLILLAPPIHMYRQLRGAYGLSRGSALWRTALLLLSAVLVLSAFVLGMVALGVFD
jgi:hypothetical protein